jgi:hypothetical protein
MNDEQNQLTSASGGDRSGRYELIWTVEASDGDTQSGLIDFEVTSGDDCASVLRTDPSKDVDKGFDLKSVKVTQADTGKTKIQVKARKAFSCKSLAKKSDDRLQLSFDTNADDTVDYTGTFACRNGDVKLSIKEADGEDVLATSTATLKQQGTVVATSVKASKFSDGDHLDIAARSTNDGDECSEEPAEGEEAPVCVDSAPDLGVLRAF